MYFARNTLMGQSRSWISRSPVLSLIDYKSLLVPHVKTSKKNILWPVVKGDSNIVSLELELLNNTTQEFLLAILAMGTSTTHQFSNTETSIQDLFCKWQKVAENPCS